jgi:hypothetical protein
MKLPGNADALQEPDAANGNKKEAEKVQIPHELDSSWTPPWGLRTGGLL